MPRRVELEVEIADTRLRQQEERLRLARLIGEPSSAAVWTLDEWVSPGMTAGTEQVWVEAALQREPAALGAQIPHQAAPMRAAEVNTASDGGCSQTPPSLAFALVLLLGVRRRRLR